MVFSSLYFLFWFLPLFFLFYFLIGKFFGIRGQNAVLFLFSILFYAWGEPVYVLLLFYSTILDYCCGRGIGWADAKGKPRARVFFLILSLIGNLALLGVFKYLGFTVRSVNSLFGATLPVPEIALPIGISFYTFQTMSYTIDVYRKKVGVQHNFLDFATFVTMFPQLIAGPVVRYADVERELTVRKTTWEGTAAGARRFLCGLAKKVLIANVMGQTADVLIDTYTAGELGALGSWVAILAYTMQIFFDFSGYSDMAIGLGQIAGFHYPENFDHPYIAASVTEFWRRWHITMSTFFRDYVYIPLGGNRVPKWRWFLNIAITWFLTGLWHGAEWHYVLWGLYFGAILILEKLFLGKYLQKTKILSHVYSLLCIVYGWVIFRLPTVERIADFTKALFGGYGWQGIGTEEVSAVYLLRQASVNTYFLIAFFFAIVFSLPVGKWVKSLSEKLPKAGNTALAIAGDCLLFVLLVFCVSELALNSYNPFIYFAF